MRCQLFRTTSFDERIPLIHNLQKSPTLTSDYNEHKGVYRNYGNSKKSVSNQTSFVPEQQTSGVVGNDIINAQVKQEQEREPEYLDLPEEDWDEGW